MRSRSGLTTSSNIGFTASPPELDLFDLDERDNERNQAFCRELEQAIIAWELDPRNFFRLKGGRRAL